VVIECFHNDLVMVNHYKINKATNPLLFSMCWDVIAREIKNTVPKVQKDADDKFNQLLDKSNAQAEMNSLEGRAEIEQSVEMAELQRTKLIAAELVRRA